MVFLVPLKKSLTLYLTRVCLHCSLRPLMHGMTNRALSISFPVDGHCFLLGFALLKVLCWLVVVL